MKTEIRKTAYRFIGFAMFAAVLLIPGAQAFASEAPKAEHIGTKEVESIEIPYRLIIQMAMLTLKM